MVALRRLSPFLLLFILLFCVASRVEAQADAAKPTVATAVAPVMMVPLTTSAAAAKEHFMLGLREADKGYAREAREHFLAAAQADESFALAHLYAAYNANSAAEYRAQLDQAVALADKASAAERMMIQIERLGFDNDPEGQLALAKELVAATPSNPRSLQLLAGIQFGLRLTADGRATLEQAIKVAPRFAAAHLDLGNSYIQTEPKDLAKGIAHIRRAVALEPNEAYVHDLMGDAYRASNNLAGARAEYTRMAELDPKHAIAFQQRGHVNSFLGKFEEARADYDKSISVGTPEEKASYPVYRALVSVHAGDAAAAEKELEDVVAAIDEMDLPNKTGAKIFPLNTQFEIALHYGHIDVLARAAERLRSLNREQAEALKSEDAKRRNEAGLANLDGWVAFRKGDYATARAKAAESMKLREADKNPNKNAGSHELLAMIELANENYEGALEHFAGANPNDPYVTFQKAVALEGAGKKAEAKVLFKQVAANNFNSTAVAMLKREAARRASKL